MFWNKSENVISTLKVSGLKKCSDSYLEIEFCFLALVLNSNGSDSATDIGQELLKV